jgi:hypothetical protein
MYQGALREKDHFFNDVKRLEICGCCVDLVRSYWFSKSDHFFFSISTARKDLTRISTQKVGQYGVYVSWGYAPPGGFETSSCMQVKMMLFDIEVQTNLWKEVARVSRTTSNHVRVVPFIDVGTTTRTRLCEIPFDRSYCAASCVPIKTSFSTRVHNQVYKKGMCKPKMNHVCNKSIRQSRY